MLKILILYLFRNDEKDLIEIDDDSAEELAKPKRCRCADTTQSLTQGGTWRSQNQQSDKSVTLPKVQEIKDEPEDSRDSPAMVKKPKKKGGGKKKQAVIEIEEGSTKLLGKMPFDKSSSSISDQENHNRKRVGHDTLGSNSGDKPPKKKTKKQQGESAPTLSVTAPETRRTRNGKKTTEEKLTEKIVLEKKVAPQKKVAKPTGYQMLVSQSPKDIMGKWFEDWDNRKWIAFVDELNETQASTLQKLLASRTKTDEAQPKAAPPKATPPKESLPKAALPKATPPKEALPKTAPPKATLPKEAPPKAAMPKATPPKEALPKTTPPKEALPKASLTNAVLPKPTLAKETPKQIPVPPNMSPDNLSVDLCQQENCSKGASYKAANKLKRSYLQMTVMLTPLLMMKMM